MAYNNNAKDTAYDFIISKIKTGFWNANDKIWTEDILSKELGVSKVAVRNAVEKLSGMGVLRKIQGSGTYVESIDASSILSMPILNISDEEVMQLLELRLYLEPASVAMFIKNSDENAIYELEKSYELMINNVDCIDRFYRADYDFHRIIAKGGKNKFVVKINDYLVDILENHQRNLYQSIGPNIGVEYHGYILRYIKEGDIELATLYMKKHMEATIEARKKVIKLK